MNKAQMHFAQTLDRHTKSEDCHVLLSEWPDGETVITTMNKLWLRGIAQEKTVGSQVFLEIIATRRAGFAVVDGQITRINNPMRFL